MNDIIHAIITNPVVMGSLLAAALKQLHQFLMDLDKSGALAPYSAQLHTAYLILAFISSAVSLASQGKLENIDTTSLSQFLTYWIQVLVGGKAMESIITPKKK